MPRPSTFNRQDMMRLPFMLAPGQWVTHDTSLVPAHRSGGNTPDRRWPWDRRCAACQAAKQYVEEMDQAWRTS